MYLFIKTRSYSEGRVEAEFESMADLEARIAEAFANGEKFRIAREMRYRIELEDVPIAPAPVQANPTPEAFPVPEVGPVDEDPPLPEPVYAEPVYAEQAIDF
jgi:hypothetical protein